MSLYMRSVLGLPMLQIAVMKCNEAPYVVSMLMNWD